MSDRPMVRPTDPPPALRILANVPGGTSVSIQRRMFDPRFGRRWFVGIGLDVGGGQDCLGLFTELFPRLHKVILYDRPQGDAQLLDNVEDNSFDFLYSSHCLEHMRDPVEAMRNWIRVVKPGGHVIVSVPDEDLYEQGHWPSRFNDDHKTTWAIDKAKSWSPVSHNVLDLVRHFRAEAIPLKIELIDHGFRTDLAKMGFDQTRTPVAELAIEIVLRKL